MLHAQGAAKLALSSVHGHAFVGRDELGDLSDELLAQIRLDAVGFDAKPV
jgi:hypothetical protein